MGYRRKVGSIFFGSFLFACCVVAGCSSNASTSSRPALTPTPADQVQELKAARILLDERQPAQARAIALKVLEKDPSSEAAHDIIGNSYNMEGRTDLAFEQFQEILRTKPTATSAHNGMGYAYLIRKEWPKAEHEFKTSISIKPDFWNYRGLGDTYAYQKKTPLAIEAYEAALRYPAPEELRNSVMKHLDELRHSPRAPSGNPGKGSQAFQGEK